MANSEVMFTELPTTSVASLTDITAAVQGYVSSTSPGVLVQETWQQVFNLFNNNFILNNVGNPNGSLSGTANTLCWDTTNTILYISRGGTVWDKVITLTAGSGISIIQNGNVIQISSSASGIAFHEVTTNTSMVSDNAYVANSSSLIELLLPATSSVGDVIYVTGYYNGVGGGWMITQAANQQIIVGDEQTTLGMGGSLSSTNQNDGIQLYCVAANTIWKNISGPQGNLTYV